MNYLSTIESILYAMGNEGIEISDLKRVTGIETDEIKKYLKLLQTKYENDNDSGLCVKLFGSKYFLFTKSENNEILSKLIYIKPKNPLTPTLLETLAIIAYNQPCTKSVVEKIRSIDPTFAFERLEELELIKMVGKEQTPGSPYAFEVTDRFYDLFGIKNINQLPKLEDIKFNEDDEVNFFDVNRDK